MMTVVQAAAELGISERRVRTLCETGRITATRFGARNWLILSVEGARNRVPGRPKAGKSGNIPVAEIEQSQGVTARPKRKRKKISQSACIYSDNGVD